MQATIEIKVSFKDQSVLWNKIQTRDEVVKRKETHKKTGHLAQSRVFWQLGGVLNR